MTDQLSPIFGLEHEYACFISGPLPTPSDIFGASGLLFEQAGASHDRMLCNGGRLYIDSGAHPEYATPECSTLDELIAADEAGNRILGDMIRTAEHNLADLGRVTTLHVLRANSDRAGTTTWGVHENYLHPDAVGYHRSRAHRLASHLASRVIYTGGGALTPDGVQDILSPRGMATRGVLNDYATGTDKPMLLDRAEPLGSTGNRVQVVCGDANVAQWATRLKVGVTAVALRLIDADRQPDLIFTSTTRAAAALTRFSRDPTLTARVGIEAHDAMTAIAIQRAWLAAAEALNADGGLHPNLAAVLPDWRVTLDALEHDPESLAGKVDWITKRHLVAALRSRGHDDTTIEAALMSYHSVRHGSLRSRLYNRGVLHRTVSVDAVLDAVTTPPSTTRAAARGALLAALKAKGLSCTASWQMVAPCDHSKGVYAEFPLTDPRDPDAGKHLKAIAELNITTPMNPEAAARLISRSYDAYAANFQD